MGSGPRAVTAAPSEQSRCPGEPTSSTPDFPGEDVGFFFPPNTQSYSKKGLSRTGAKPGPFDFEGWQT